MQDRAVLLVNLGSPDAPEEEPVRRYLNQFLMDPYVIQLPWVLRRLIVSLFVLPKRPKDSAKAYRSVWQEDGSPLISLSRQLQQQLQLKTPLPVGLAMRYGNPSIESELLSLAANPDVKEVLFIPLYPHYADSTVTTCIVEAQSAIEKHQLNLQLQVLPPFYRDNDYIEALVTSCRIRLAQDDWDHVVFSYHGLPESHLTKADPTGAHCLTAADCCHNPSPAHASCYRHQVLKTTELVVAALQLSKAKYSVSFQSRLGRAKWLEPSTTDTLDRLVAEGHKRVLVLCPAFVTDCLETLEEIAIQGEEQFITAGGESLELIPCLNTHPAWIETLAKWCNSYNVEGTAKLQARCSIQ